jgi:hypothetical protein
MRGAFFGRRVTRTLVERGSTQALTSLPPTGGVGGGVRCEDRPYLFSGAGE